jgi:hypothetical protein
LAISADESILETEWNELVVCTPPNLFSLGLGTSIGAVVVWLTDCWSCSLLCVKVCACWLSESDCAWPKLKNDLFLQSISHDINYLFANHYDDDDGDGDDNLLPWLISNCFLFLNSRFDILFDDEITTNVL